MRRRKLAVTLFLATVLVAGATAVQAAGPDDTPAYDKPFFIKSAQSVARADLLACRNKDAKVLEPSDASAAAFSNALNGIWINRNGRTVHGRPVETDTAWYIQMDGLTGTAILLDRNNMGLDTLTAPFVDFGASQSLTEKTRERLAVRPNQPLALRQVNCTYEMVDEYVKVSDEMLIEALVATTPIQMTEGLNLEGAWEQLKAAEYFEYLDMPTDYLAGQAVRTRTKLGDSKRYGFTPEGVKVTEAMVAEGKAPGAEYEMPMQVGALFKITLTERENGPGGFKSVHLHMDAEYAGTGINLVPGEEVESYEQGEFVMEGGAFVSARSVSNDLAYESGWCGNKNGLDPVALSGEEVVQNPEFFFERMVIGMP